MINLFILLTTILIFSVLFAGFIASKETIEKKELYKNGSGHGRHQRHHVETWNQQECNS